MKLKLWNLKIALVILPLGFLAAGCNQGNNPATETATAAQNTNAVPATNADNSANNIRDRNQAALTPGDQGNSDADRETTRKIRRALVSGTNAVGETNAFSVTAQNVKIITVDGKVTLRGPVNSADEKTGIETIAQNVAGPGNVNNQLEVKTSQ